MWCKRGIIIIILLGGVCKTTKNLSEVAISVDIRKGHLPNISLECYWHTKLLSKCGLSPCVSVYMYRVVTSKLLNSEKKKR